MTSYASQPTPDWPAFGPVAPGPGEAPPPDDDQEPPDREWQTGSGEKWPTASLRRWQDEPAGQAEQAEPQPGPVGEQVPAREQWAGRLRDQAPTLDQRAGRLPDQAPALDQQAGRRPDEAPDPDQRAGRRPDQAPDPDQRAGRLTDQAPGAADVSSRQVRRAVLSYLGVPFLGFLPPLAVYLITPRTSAFARRHAAQALNLSITVFLYNICALLLGGLLALDTVAVAVLIMVPLLAALWIIALVYLVLAGVAASRGEDYQIPGWLCATLLR